MLPRSPPQRALLDTRAGVPLCTALTSTAWAGFDHPDGEWPPRENGTAMVEVWTAATCYPCREPRSHEHCLGPGEQGALVTAPPELEKSRKVFKIKHS